MNRNIYLDNNATTMMPVESISALNLWINKGNPSSGYASAILSRKHIRDFRNCISANCGFTLVENFSHNPPLDAFRIIFTSCASESNITAINMVVNATTTGSISATSATSATSASKRTTPHIITSAFEHKSILLLLDRMESDGVIELTKIKPCLQMCIDPEDVRREIKPNTVLITIMHANNELGVINDIDAIAKIAHSASILFHTDTVQTFGKYKISSHVDMYSISFHKIFGPCGIGALIIREKLICGYKLKSIITGTQNYGLRGGTENIALIAAAFAGYKIIICDRINKNNRLCALKKHIMGTLSANFSTVLYPNYTTCKKRNFIVYLMSDERQFMHNTLLLSIIRKDPPAICNVKLRQALEDNNIIIGIGSACNTSSKKASHVLYSIDADKYVRAGTLRISLSDMNTMEHINEFLNVFIWILKANLGND
jgi:cysteine desulfurase